MTNDPWGTALDPFGASDVFDQLPLGNASPKRLSQWQSNALAVAAAAAAVAAPVISLAGSAGVGAVGLAALGYLLAVLADISARRARFTIWNYSRPPMTVALRVVTFGLAVWVAGLAAYSGVA